MMKRVIYLIGVSIAALCAALGLLSGCGRAALFADAPAQTPAPEPAQVFTVLATPEPTPRPTPEPTPEPTDYYGLRARDNLLMEIGQIRLVAAPEAIRLYEAPDEDARSIELKNRLTDRTRSELIVLSEVTSARGSLFYHVRSAFSEDTGYVLASRTRTSRLDKTGASGYALMLCAGCPLLKSPLEESVVLSQESYHAARILGEYQKHYYVRTEDGGFGYVKPDQLRMISEEELEAYLAAGVVPAAPEAFDLEGFIGYAQHQAQAASTEELLVDALTRQGFFFLPGYYRFYQKELENDELYPHAYREDAYNSLLFKLWNSAGNLVYYRGNPTQWDYVPASEAPRRGDLLFFSEYGGGELAVVETYEIVFRGQSSGYVTACGLYLGDDRMLWVDEGNVEIVENLSASGLWRFYDSARRVHAEVANVRAHLIETMIASAYDKLGTPYDNFARMGETSFDCSGLVGWAMRRAGLTQRRGGNREFVETTASGLCHIEALYMGGRTLPLTRMTRGEDRTAALPEFERGDLIFLLGEKQARISHVMIYLGDMRVIHSTTVTDEYRGTLVAGFRAELQKLYTSAVRIAPFE